MDEYNLISWRDFYSFGGLHSLIVNGCPSNIIGVIRDEDREDMGITTQDDKAAHKAIKSAEKINKALVIKLPHNKWRSATDCLLFSIQEFFIYLSDGSAVIHVFDNAESEFRKQFGRSIDFVDDMYFLVPCELTESAFRLFSSLA